MCPGRTVFYSFHTAVSRDRNYSRDLKIQDDSAHCTLVSVRQQQTGGISVGHYCHPGVTTHQPDLLLPHLASAASTTRKGHFQWKYLDQPLGFFRIQNLQRDTKSTNTKSSEYNALPGRKLPAALLKATAICLLYACFHEGLFNRT